MTKREAALMMILTFLLAMLPAYGERPQIPAEWTARSYGQTDSEVCFWAARGPAVPAGEFDVCYSR